MREYRQKLQQVVGHREIWRDMARYGEICASTGSMCSLQPLASSLTPTLALAFTLTLTLALALALALTLTLTLTLTLSASRVRQTGSRLRCRPAP